MSKFLKMFFVVFILLMIILCNFVQAINIDMNLTNTLNSNNTSNDVNHNSANTSNSLSQNTNADSNSHIPSNPQTVLQSTTSTLSNLPEANLGLSNILSIILIVIGVLLVFLAIAILIRLKH